MTSRVYMTAFLVTAFAALAAPVQAQGPEAAVERFFDAYSKMDLEGMMDVYSSDAVFVDVAQRHTVEGAEALRPYLAQLLAVHSRAGVEVQQRIASGDRIAVKFLYTGRISGEALRKLTGKQTCQDVDYEVPATSWFQVENGRIVRQTDFIDLATLQEVKAKASGATQ